MPWSVKHESTSNIVEVVYFGHVTGAELREAATERIRLQIESSSDLVLVDASEIESLVAGVLDVHKLPSELYSSTKAKRGTRLALVWPRPQEARKTAQHFENACINRGWFVRSFEDRQDAIYWLQDK